MSERPHVLIVDDDREIRGLLAQYLEKHEFRATAVPDGREMRRVLERSHVDLLVLDLMLPGEDGLLLCRELRGRIKAVLPRSAHAPRDPSPESVRGFSFDGWRLNTVTRTLTSASGNQV